MMAHGPMAMSRRWGDDSFLPSFLLFPWPWPRRPPPRSGLAPWAGLALEAFYFLGLFLHRCHLTIIIGTIPVTVAVAAQLRLPVSIVSRISLPLRFVPLPLALLPQRSSSRQVLPRRHPAFPPPPPPPLLLLLLLLLIVFDLVSLYKALDRNLCFPTKPSPFPPPVIQLRQKESWPSAHSSRTPTSKTNPKNICSPAWPFGQPSLWFGLQTNATCSLEWVSLPASPIHTPSWLSVPPRTSTGAYIPVHARTPGSLINILAVSSRPSCKMSSLSATLPLLEPVLSAVSRLGMSLSVHPYHSNPNHMRPTPVTAKVSLSPPPRQTKNSNTSGIRCPIQSRSNV